MLSRVITYTNPFTGESVTEEHWFHIPNADLLEMNMEMHKDTYTTKAGEKVEGLQAHWQRLVDNEDAKGILDSAKDLIRRAYGKRDGDKFLQSDEIWNDFAATGAYSQLRWELAADTDLMESFFNGIFSKDIQKSVAEFAEKTGTVEEPPRVEVINAEPVTPQVLTTAEAAEMDTEELRTGLASGKYRFAP